MKRFIVHVIAIFIAVYILVNYLHFGRYDTIYSAIIFSAILAIINGLIGLIPNIITKILGCISFGIIPLVLNIIAVLLSEYLVVGFRLNGILQTVVLIVLVSIITGISNIFV